MAKFTGDGQISTHQAGVFPADGQPQPGPPLIHLTTLHLLKGAEYPLHILGRYALTAVFNLNL